MFSLAILKLSNNSAATILKLLSGTAKYTNTNNLTSLAKLRMPYADVFGYQSAYHIFNKQAL